MSAEEHKKAWFEAGTYAYFACPGRLAPDKNADGWPTGPVAPFDDITWEGEENLSGHVAHGQPRGSSCAPSTTADGDISGDEEPMGELAEQNRGKRKRAVGAAGSEVDASDTSDGHLAAGPTRGRRQRRMAGARPKANASVSQTKGPADGVRDGQPSRRGRRPGHLNRRSKGVSKSQTRCPVHREAKTTKTGTKKSDSDDDHTATTTDDDDDV